MAQVYQKNPSRKSQRRNYSSTKYVSSNKQTLKQLIPILRTQKCIATKFMKNLSVVNMSGGSIMYEIQFDFRVESIRILIDSTKKHMVDSDL